MGVNLFCCVLNTSEIHIEAFGGYSVNWKGVFKLCCAINVFILLGLQDALIAKDKLNKHTNYVSGK